MTMTTTTNDGLDNNPDKYEAFALANASELLSMIEMDITVGKHMLKQHRLQMARILAFEPHRLPSLLVKERELENNLMAAQRELEHWQALQATRTE